MSDQTDQTLPGHNPPRSYPLIAAVMQSLSWDRTFLMIDYV